MLIRTSAIVVAVLSHGEHGAIVRAMTPTDGLQPGYVRGGRSRRLRPVLLPGNIVAAEYRARTDAQLAGLTAELVESRAPLMAEPLAAAAIAWVCALTASALPEAQPYPRIHAGLDGMLAAIEAAPSARGWVAGLVRYELLCLAELGFGFDEDALSRHAAIGPSWGEIVAELDATGVRLAERLLTGRTANALDARERLTDRLKRMV